MELDRQYLFHAPTRVVFGFGTVATLGRERTALGARHALVVTGPGVVRAGLLESAFVGTSAAGITTCVGRME